MAQSPNLKVYNPSGEYVASCKYGEDAAMIAGCYGDGATIRDGHRHVVWAEGREDFPAGDSWDRVACLIKDRIEARWEAGQRRRAERHSALA